MNTFNTRSLIETALMAVLTTVMMLLGSFPPLVIFVFIASTPIIVLTARQGLKYGASGAIISGILMLVVMDPISALIGFSLAGVPGVAMGELFRLKKPMSIAILIATVFFAIGFGLNFSLVAQSGVGNPVQIIENSYSEFVKSFEASKPLFKLSTEEMKIITDSFEYSKNLTITLIPAFVVLMGFFMSLANFFTTRVVLKRTGFEIAPTRKFRYFRLPESLVPGLMIIFVMTYITGYFGYINTDAIFTNVVFLFSFLFAFQGVSVFTYFCFAIKGKELQKILFVFASFFLNITLVFAAIGMMDAAINLRKLYENRKVER